jgi:hypothetical protein
MATNLALGIAPFNCANDGICTHVGNHAISSGTNATDDNTGTQATVAPGTEPGIDDGIGDGGYPLGVDLGAAYLLEKIKYWMTRGTPTSGFTQQVRVHAKLNAGDAYTTIWTDAAALAELSGPYTQTLAPGNRGPWRYLRFERIGGNTSFPSGGGKWNELGAYQYFGTDSIAGAGFFAQIIG